MIIDQIIGCAVVMSLAYVGSLYYLSVYYFKNEYANFTEDLDDDHLFLQ